MILSGSKCAQKGLTHGQKERQMKRQESFREDKRRNEVYSDLTRRNLELEDELYRAKTEIDALKKELETYASIEQMIQKICEPIINQIVNDFQNVWVQRIASQVEENVTNELNQVS